MRAVLCIGGLDPSGRAGILADARAVAAFGVRPVCVATALTYQTSRRMTGFERVSATTLLKRISLVLEDEQVEAVKVGMLASAENAAAIARLSLSVPIVLDTPLRASNGGDLFPRASVVGAYEPLLRKAALATPNANEVFLLQGEPVSDDREEAIEAARRLGAQAVLLKGGHLPGETIEDILLRPVDETTRYRFPRLPGTFRGTGCRLASAIAARLALRDSLTGAVEQATQWMHRELQAELEGPR